MKISYNTLKKYIPNITSVEEVAEDLIMHTAEVEEIHYQGEAFNNIVYWTITSIANHDDADALKVCQVNVWEAEDIQIVCGGSNLAVWQGVAVAKIWASVLWHGEGEPVVMKKSSIRWVESLWMICASEEIWLKEEYPAADSKEILDFGDLKAQPWTPIADLLWKNDCYLEVDNKAINHRPDLFSHVWIAREICAISGEKFDFDFKNTDVSNLPDLGITNTIPEAVKRYMWVKASWVQKQESPDYVKEVIASHWIDSKRLLVDITNYSLYFYGQPTHIFDADKVTGSITIRFANPEEKFVALDGKEYTLCDEDIVIADSVSVLALWWIIGGLDSSVSETTTSIIIESANFDQAIIRKTWKKIWVRTDALNVFEKDLQPEMCSRWLGLIISELEKAYPDFKLESASDIYPVKQESVSVEYNLDFINNLIGKEYSSEVAEKIIENLWIEICRDAIHGIWEDPINSITTLKIPFWRKDLNYKADIAEEIARIDGFDNIETTPPSINMWAVAQSSMYNIKNTSRTYFTAKGFYDMYNYSFVNIDLMEKLKGNCDNLVPLRNALSEDMTHMKGSLIPNLMKSLEDNIRETKDLSLFELEKVFALNADNEISEHYEISSVVTSNAEIPYYEIQTLVSDYLKTIWVDNFSFNTARNTSTLPSYCHPWRTAEIVVRGKSIWVVWEIHPEISKKFDVSSRVAFFSINLDMITDAVFSTVKATDISQFQMNNFDICFVVDKSIEWKQIQTAIINADKKLIKKVELFDIFESEEKLPWKRSLSFKVYIQSDEWTLDDKVKNKLIEEIVKKVEKKGGELR